jgi:Family of unknown function (DUF6062)
MKETSLQDRKRDFVVDLRTRGCAVCNHVIKTARDFFAQWQCALAYEEKAQSDFADELGFCAVHIWQLDEMSSPLGESSGLTRLIKRVSELLSTAEHGSIVATRVQEMLRTAKSCRVCRMLSEAEFSYIGGLAEFLRNPNGRQIFRRSQGVCLRHLARLLAITSDELHDFLLAAASRQFEKLSEQTQTYAAKRNSLRRDLINHDEEDAYLRALIHLVGARDYSAP